MTTAELDSLPHPSAGDRLGAGGVVLLIAGLTGNLLFGASTLALPDIVASLGLTTAGGALVVSLFSVGFAASLVLGGRLGDLWGRRAVLRVALLGVALSSLLVAVAPGLAVLLVARVLQGITNGLLLPQVLSTIQHVTEGSVRARWTAAYAAVIGAGTALGQLSAGVLVACLPGGMGWRLSFVLSAAIALLALALSGFVPATRSKAGGSVDVLGAVLLGLGTAGLVLPLGLGDELRPVWGGPLIAALAVLLLGAFFLWERRTAPERALLPLTVLRNRTLLLGLTLTLLFFAGYGAFVYYFTLTMRAQMGLSALQAALVLLPFAAGFVVMSAALPLVLRRVPHRRIMAAAACAQGSVLILIAVLVFVGWPSPNLGLLLVLLVVLGVAQALMYGPLIGTVMGSVPHTLSGLASGLLSTVQQAAFAFSVPVFALLVSATRAEPAGGFLFCAGTQVVLGMLFLLVVGRLHPGR